MEKYCSGAGHRWQYGASALHAGYLRLHTHSGCEILIALPIQLGLHESASMLRYTHSACLVKSNLFMILVSVHHPFCRYMSLPYPRSVTECQLPNVFSPSLPNDFSYHADVIITLQLHYEGGVASQISFYIDPKYSIFYAHVKLLSSFLSRATALEGQDLLIIEASRSHSVKHATLGRTPLDEWSAWRRDLYLTTHNTHKRHIHAPGGIRTRNPSKRAAAYPGLRPRGHCDWQSNDYAALQSQTHNYSHCYILCKKSQELKCVGSSLSIRSLLTTVI